MSDISAAYPAICNRPGHPSTFSRTRPGHPHEGQPGRDLAVPEQPSSAPRAGTADERQEQVLADIRASPAARDLECAETVDPDACALLVRMAAQHRLELSFLSSAENFTARLTDTRPPYGGRCAVLHFQSWNAYWSGDPGGRGLDASEVAAWLAAYRAHPRWHADSLYDDMKARMRSAEAAGRPPGRTCRARWQRACPTPGCAAAMAACPRPRPASQTRCAQRPPSGTCSPQARVRARGVGAAHGREDTMTSQVSELRELRTTGQMIRPYSPGRNERS